MLTACATSPTIIFPKEASTSLVLIKPQDSSLYMLGTTDTVLSERRDDMNIDATERHFAGTCKGQIATPEAAIGALVIPFLIGKATPFVVNKIDAALQAELKEYTATYSASTSSPLYSESSSSGPALAHQCFRFTRFEGKDADKKIAMDFLGLLEIENSSILVVTPLRLYYTKTAAKLDSSKKFGLTLVLNSTTTWREGNKGLLNEGPRTILIELAPEFKNDKPYIYTKFDAKLSRKILPLPPWSIWDGYKYGASSTRFEISAAEVATPPLLLKNISTIFHDNKDAISKQLESAALKVVAESQTESK